MLLAACAPPPIQRPREGAPPVVGGTPVRLVNAVPPTLSAAGSLSQTQTPTPALEPPPSPGLPSTAALPGSPGLSPIVSGLQPAPGASLPAGDVVISARVSGSSDLVDVTAFLDGEPIGIEPVGPTVRVKTVSFVRTLAAGTHEVRIQARDDRNQLGGYRWQFSVGEGRQPVAVPAAKPAPPTAAVQPRTPIPLPTRRPTVALPGPTATAPARSPVPR